jgi:hypothetical protein
MSEIRKNDECWQRRANALRAPKADQETRVLLIAHERGLTQKQLEKFYFQRRKNCKPRFNYLLFAKKQGISLEWLFDGDLRAHPRGAVAREPAPRALAAGELQKFRQALSGLDDRRLELLFRHFESLADGDPAA